MNRLIIFRTLILSFFGLIGCLEDISDETCDVNTLAIAASVTIDEEAFCYQTGSLVYDTNNDLLILELYAVKNEKTTDHKILAQFQVPAEGYSFNEIYTAVDGSYFDAVNLSSGFIQIEGDNYEQDPSLLKYYGGFQLNYQSEGSPTVTEIEGTFSIE